MALVRVAALDEAGVQVPFGDGSGVCLVKALRGARTLPLQLVGPGARGVPLAPRLFCSTWQLLFPELGCGEPSVTAVCAVPTLGRFPPV